MKKKEGAAAIEAILFTMGDSVEVSKLADALEESIEEGGYGCTISNYDMSEVGEVQCEDWTYDEEEYQEWLVDNELQDTLENKIAYIEDYNVEIGLIMMTLLKYLVKEWQNRLKLKCFSMVRVSLILAIYIQMQHMI